MIAINADHGSRWVQAWYARRLPGLYWTSTTAGVQTWYARRLPGLYWTSTTASTPPAFRHPCMRMQEGRLGHNWAVAVLPGLIYLYPGLYIYCLAIPCATPGSREGQRQSHTCTGWQRHSIARHSMTIRRRSGLKPSARFSGHHPFITLS